MKSPKEDPADKAARLMERRTSELEQVRAGMQNAASFTSDLRSVYGFGGLTRRAPSIFASAKAGAAAK